MKKGNPYKILILSDLKKGTDTTIRSAVSLSKIIDGQVELFHVKNASEIVGKENQLSAMRNINKEYVKTENKIKKHIQHAKEAFNTSINYGFAFGSPREEITKYLKEYQPDIVVLGRRKRRPFKLMGDYLTPFVLKQHKGAVLIAAEGHVLEPHQEISLGLFNNDRDHLNIDFADELLKSVHEPLTSFKIIKSEEDLDAKPKDRNQVEYVFNQTDGVVKKLSSYLKKSKVDLLCVNRENNEAINQLNVSMLVSN